MTEHPSQQAIYSTIKIQAGSKLASHGFCLLGLSNSGLAAAGKPGDTTVYVRNATGMKAGHPVTIGSGADAEDHKITSVGTAAANRTTIWQPLPDGPVLTIPAGSENLPVTSTSGLEVGQKVALGYSAKYPTIPGGTEQFEVVTLTEVGKPGTQAYLATNAMAGTNNIKVTSVENISAGDKIRLDINAVGHGIGTVTVSRVGTAAKHTNLALPANEGATSVRCEMSHEFSAGDSVMIGTPANQESVRVTSASQSGSGSRRGAQSSSRRHSRVRILLTKESSRRARGSISPSRSNTRIRRICRSAIEVSGLRSSPQRRLRILAMNLCRHSAPASCWMVCCPSVMVSMPSCEMLLWQPPATKGILSPTNGSAGRNSRSLRRYSTGPSPFGKAAWCCAMRPDSWQTRDGAVVRHMLDRIWQF